jgi:hypothetical protein
MFIIPRPTRCIHNSDDPSECKVCIRVKRDKVLRETFKKPLKNFKDGQPEWMTKLLYE